MFKIVSYYFIENNCRNNLFEIILSEDNINESSNFSWWPWNKN